MFIGILKMIGLGVVIGFLMYVLIYSLAVLIWGAMTWKGDDK